MNLKTCTLILFTLISFTLHAQEVNRSAYYAAFASEDLKKIEAETETVKKSTDTDKNALEGGLLMRQAAFIKGPGKKLSSFKEGHKLLEEAINSDPNNVEFRFIRLMVQENAPKFLKYNKNLDEDSQIIKDNYKKLPQNIQEAIAGYSKSSKSLGQL
jgi:Cu/Ag efflux protein CusF